MIEENIKTGYFAQTKKYVEAGYLPVSIARYSPKGFQGDYLLELAPSWSMVSRLKENHMSMPDDVYEEAYVKILHKYNVSALISNVCERALNNGHKGIVLLCYEKDRNDCHRSILSNYLENEYQVHLEEFDLSKEKQVQKDQQLELDLS